MLLGTEKEDASMFVRRAEAERGTSMTEIGPETETEIGGESNDSNPTLVCLMFRKWSPLGSQVDFHISVVNLTGSFYVICFMKMKCNCTEIYLCGQVGFCHRSCRSQILGSDIVVDL